MTNKEEGKMVKKGNNKKKAGIIAGSVVAAGIVAGGATIGIIAGTAKVTVKYETGVDNITFKNDPIKKGGSVNNLPTPMRPGYKFLGWYLDADGNVPATSNTKFSKDTTLYAQWKANEYSVTLIDKVLDTNLDTATYKAAYSDNNQNTINLPILSNVYNKAGTQVLYTFRGWADETGTLVASVDQSINNISIPYNMKLYGGILYAVWEGSPVEVWFGETKLNRSVSVGENVTLSQGQAGEDFNYWSVNAATGEYNWEILGAPGASFKVTQDMVSEKNNRLAVEFSANYYEEATAQIEYRVQTEIFTDRAEAEDAVAGREANYNFDAWYLDEEYATVADLNNLPTNIGRVVLYAKLTGKEVIVNFDYGNAELRAGQTKVPSMKVNAGETILLPAYARSFAGYNVDFVA